MDLKMEEFDVFLVCFIIFSEYFSHPLNIKHPSIFHEASSTVLLNHTTYFVLNHASTGIPLPHTSCSWLTQDGDAAFVLTNSAKSHLMVRMEVKNGGKMHQLELKRTSVMSRLWNGLVSDLADLREDFIFNYAMTLMSHKSEWQIGVDYLDFCEKNGRAYVELCLERIPLTTEHKARNVLYLAKKRNLDDLVKGICKVMARRAIDSQMFGTALHWVIESKDVRFATDLANRWIKEYSETGQFHCFEILKNLGFCMMVSDQLTFLGKYCEFHKLYQDKELKKAAVLLVSLLTSGLVPKPFQMVMLLDALPLLEHNEPVFTMTQTTKLTACLEGLSRMNSYIEEKSELKSKERLIRLALARNLSRSFLHENSVMRH